MHKNIYELRAMGREYCVTEGSNHYKGGNIESADLIIAHGMGEDWMLGNIIKYATRFKITRNLEDLKKVVDYAQILTGVELDKHMGIEVPQDELFAGQIQFTPVEKPIDPYDKIIQLFNFQPTENEYFKELEVEQCTHVCPLGLTCCMECDNMCNVRCKESK